MDKIRRNIKWICNVLFVIYASGLMLLAAPSLLGLQAFAVTSGSMEPELPVGTAVYVKGAAFEDISEGDIITFLADGHGTKVTHRVTGVKKEEQAFTTKGDANDIADARPVNYENVVGKVIYFLPYTGYLLILFSSKAGKISAICVLGILWLLTILLEEEQTENNLKRKES